MNNPFEYKPDADCQAAFRELTGRIESLKASHNPEAVNFCRELEAGKMLGVLIAADTYGERHTLYAFSGQLGHGGFHFPGFVEPVFDYLQPDGYFKTKEADISLQNAEIDAFETEVLAIIRENYRQSKERGERVIAKYKEKYRLSKSERERRRKEGVTDKEAEALIRQSQFEKAEIRRLKIKLSTRFNHWKKRWQRLKPG